MDLPSPNDLLSDALVLCAKDTDLDGRIGAGTLSTDAVLYALCGIAKRAGIEARALALVARDPTTNKTKKVVSFLELNDRLLHLEFRQDRDPTDGPRMAALGFSSREQAQRLMGGAGVHQWHPNDNDAYENDPLILERVAPLTHLHVALVELGAAQLENTTPRSSQRSRRSAL